MPTLADSLVSSSARKLALRMRPDLSARRHRYQGRAYWVVKEPVGLHYFRFQEEEFALLQMLDGQSSLDEIKRAFESRFPPQKIGVEELQHFIGMLHRGGLVIANVPGQGRQLLLRRQERRRKELVGKLTNILAIRFKGIDPERLLKWLHPRLRWLYSPLAVAACCLSALSALALVAVQFDVFQSKLPAFQDFFTLKNAIWLSVALAVTKVIHEFGHGLTCKHFGGECHEMGLMILVLTPCLYCNVSDSWMLPNKWHRAAIGAAGMYVEVVIASISTFIWWFSEPGLLNNLCLSTMFVCSVSTVVFNSNPLLRYDGYYILSDLTEIPNLRQKASDILNRKLGQWCLGLEPRDDPFLPERHQLFFALYSVAAAAYRWIVVFSILWFLYQIWKPYRLEIIGQMIGVAALYSLLVQPLWKVGKFFHVPGRIDKVKKPRMYATLALWAALVLAVLFVPLPYRVYATLEVQPRGATSVNVEVAGQLEELFVRPGDRVKARTQLARLSNLDLALQIAELEGQRDEYRKRLASLEHQRFRNPDAGHQLGAVREALDAVQEQLQEKQLDQRRLTVVSPVAGTVLPPPHTPLRPSPDGELPTWSGTPLEERNLGSYLDENVLLCKVGNPREMEALLVIDQADVEFLKLGQKVDVKLDELDGQILAGTITEIASESLKVAPKQLSNKGGGDLATKTDEAGVQRPLSTSYQARVPLDDPRGLLRAGLRGRGRIHAPAQSLGQRIWRYVSRTFNFRL